MIAIIDYGMGNIHSVQKALQLYGAKTTVTNKPQDLETCQSVVLPGVGAFDDAMRELKKQGLISVLKEFIKNKKIFLGICLGMQILFDKSEEAKEASGLGILKGKVKRFENRVGIRVPHMGWNQLKINPPSPKGFGGLSAETSVKADKNECPLLKGIPDNSYVYFCHSYYPKPEDKQVIAAACDYGGDFAALLWQDNIYGVQFHPEKSQAVGLKMLENFVNL